MCKRLDDNATAMTNEIMQDVNACVEWYLMASYSYYECGNSILRDIMFDSLCGQILADWTQIDHKYKPLLDMESIECHTAFELNKADYPEEIVERALTL